MRGMSITIELPPDVEKRLAGLPDLGQRVADFLRGQAEQMAAQAGRTVRGCAHWMRCKRGSRSIQARRMRGRRQCGMHDADAR